MTKLLGYARVSTADQNLDVQRDALKRAGVSTIFSEKMSGTSRNGRDELEKVLSVLGRGDTLAVVRLDRLGRSLRDLANIAHEIEKAGAHLRILEQGVDTATAAGRAFFGMLAVFAAFETDVRRERQAEGIAKAKGAGVYKGRKRSIDPIKVAKLKKAGRGVSEIAVELGISRQSVYRALNETGV
jgi:DNA invertase Pin-like site-specific DNA recombinase